MSENNEEDRGGPPVPSINIGPKFQMERKNLSIKVSATEGSSL